MRTRRFRLASVFAALAVQFLGGALSAQIGPGDDTRPFDFTVSSLSDSSLELLWSGDSTGIARYNIERATDGSPFELIVQVDAGAVDNRIKSPPR